MIVTWQDIIALSLVATAAGYLGWHGWRFFARRKGAGCGGGCSGCASGEKGASIDGKPLVTIEPLARSNRDRVDRLNSNR